MEKMALTLFGDIYRNKKIIVTGNTGFKGSWLSAWLQNMGAQVTGFSDRIPTEPSFYVATGLDKQVNQVWGDIRDLAAVTQLIKTLAIVFY